jgi:hypothetical protein
MSIRRLPVTDIDYEVFVGKPPEDKIVPVLEDWLKIALALWEMNPVKFLDLKIFVGQIRKDSKFRATADFAGIQEIINELNA